MGGACREGFLSSCCCFHPQYSPNDSPIGNHNKEKGDEDDEGIDGKVHQDIGGCVRAAQAQQRWEVTENVLDFITASEGQLGDQDDFGNGTQKTTSPTTGSHPATESWGHDCRVVEGPADGQVSVISHGCEKVAFRGP